VVVSDAFASVAAGGAAAVAGAGAPSAVDVGLAVAAGGSLVGVHDTTGTAKQATASSERRRMGTSMTPPKDAHLTRSRAEL